MPRGAFFFVTSCILSYSLSGMEMKQRFLSAAQNGDLLIDLVKAQDLKGVESLLRDNTKETLSLACKDTDGKTAEQLARELNHATILRKILSFTISKKTQPVRVSSAPAEASHQDFESEIAYRLNAELQEEAADDCCQSCACSWRCNPVDFCTIS